LTILVAGGIFFFTNLEYKHMLLHFFGRSFFIFFFLSCLYSQVSLAGSAGNDTVNNTNNSQSTETSNSGNPTNNTTSTDNSQVAAAPASDTSTSTTSSSDTSTSTTLTTPTQQTGIVQFNNSGYSTLTYPNCGGICGFGIVRLTPSNNGNVNPEAVMGVVMQLNSPEKTYAQAQHNLSKAQSDRIAQEDAVLLLSKLADAVEQCKDAHANLLALAVAKKLGITPEKVLSYARKQSRQCNSQ
jgi:hypothetical protein